MFNEIEKGAEFYFTADDYLTPDTKSTGTSANPRGSSRRQSLPTPRSSVRVLKRPRRSAAKAVVSYVVPDSDEDDKEAGEGSETKPAAPKATETALQKWVTHLSDMLRAEERKVSGSHWIEVGMLIRHSTRQRGKPGRSITTQVYLRLRR